MQEVKEISINDENREEIMKMREQNENITPLPAYKEYKKSEVKKQQYHFQSAQFIENKKKLKQFWKTFTEYQFKCQLNDFDPWQMLLDLGLIYKDQEDDKIYHYTAWLWKYCEKRHDMIRQRSSTIAKLLNMYILDSQQLTENDF